jgi:hypothetical protein
VIEEIVLGAVEMEEWKEEGVEVGLETLCK